LVLGLALIAFAIAGLAVDGTRAFLMRRTLQNAADASALAGASEVDVRTYYSTGGRRIALDPWGARRVAADWLSRRALPVRAAIASTTSDVHVVLRGHVPTTFLAIVGIKSIPVAVESDARPIGGGSGAIPP
jgi:hypothetical protein